jgi:hypothetical protein
VAVQREGLGREVFADPAEGRQITGGSTSKRAILSALPVARTSRLGAMAADETPEAEEQQEAEPVFLNRAERRAKAKGKGGGAGKVQGQAREPLPGGRGSVQSPRQYGTRRSG